MHSLWYCFVAPGTNKNKCKTLETKNNKHGQARVKWALTSREAEGQRSREWTRRRKYPVRQTRGKTQRVCFDGLSCFLFPFSLSFVFSSYLSSPSSFRHSEGCVSVVWRGTQLHAKTKVETPPTFWETPYWEVRAREASSQGKQKIARERRRGKKNCKENLLNLWDNATLPKPSVSLAACAGRQNYDCNTTTYRGMHVEEKKSGQVKRTTRRRKKKTYRRTTKTSVYQHHDLTTLHVPTEQG